MNSLFDEGSGLGSIQTIGIVNSLKTGNIMIDMAIAMLIPVIIGFIMNSISKLKTIISEIDCFKIFGRSADLHTRTIRHSSVQSSYTTTDLGASDTQNELLIKAIQLYLNDKKILKLNQADLELRQVSEKKNNKYYFYDHDQHDTTTVADSLSKYKVIKKPLNRIWLDLGKHGLPKDMHNVRLYIQENKEDIDGKESGSVRHRRDLALHFSSEGKDSIDVFIDTAYKWYLEQLRALEDNSRYLYELKQAGFKEKEDGSDIMYRRYQLSDEKTFESLFFKEKETILKIVDNFTNKTGKYSIKGYNNKLGLLLHGPPGTGKTSLIKALAQLTGRSIVNVPLARISTNAELAALFFDQKYQVEGESVPVKLNFKDVIFVMEDVDAVGKVVRRRDGKTNADTSACTELVDMPINKSPWRMLIESTDDNCKELVKLLIEKSERLKENAKDPSNLCSTARRITALPGLSLVGEDVENETVSNITKESIEAAKKQMERQSAVSEFIGKQAMMMMQMMENGAEVTEEFENELLGLSSSGDSVLGSFISLLKPTLSRDDGDSKDELVTDSSGSDTSTSMVEIGPQMGPIEGCGSESSEKDNKNGTYGTSSSGYSAWKAKRDELNLSGILNVLDGVVDTPGRLLVMTTNHPEMLDPALIRPGRIDKKLLLSYLRYEDLVNMLQHYFQLELNASQKVRLSKAVDSPPSLKITPAQVEQMACEHEDIEEMIGAIENVGTYFRGNRMTRKNTSVSIKK